MKYKLYTDEIYDSPREQVLRGRGISNVDEWLAADMSIVNDWRALDGMEAAVALVKNAVAANIDTCIIVDCDVDGYTSAAIIINFLYSLYPDYVEHHVIYLHHLGKQHGLADMVDLIPENTGLIICPDSASNDYIQHEYFNGKSKILILDHHEADHISTSPNVVTVNNQLCSYSNKMFSGAGIAWQFCRAYNELVGTNGNESIDLCALGNCGDMMSFQSLETKAIVAEGFKNVTNPFFYQMLEDNEYIINKYGGIGYKAVAFGVVPFINATVRSGTAEEKDDVFRAMCLPWCYEKVNFTKRGHKGEQVPLYVQAAYETASIKRRQTKLETESLALLENKILEENLTDNSILVFTCEPGDVEPNIRGLAANKLASKYQRPCLVLTKTKNKEDSEYMYQGSGRNYGMSEIDDLKSVIETTGCAEYVQGHGNAFGCGIYEKNMSSFIEEMNNLYRDIPREATYWVDYIWSMDEVPSNIVLELAELSYCWGQDIPASQVAIEDIDLSQCRLQLCGARNDTLRLVLPNGFVMVKFGIDEETFEEMLEPNTFMNCIVSPSRNEWQGRVSGEGMIDDFTLQEKWVF